MKDKVTVIAADDRRIFRKGPKSLLSEKEHIQVFADGHCNQEVADIFCISRKTVKNRRAHIVRRPGCRDRWASPRMPPVSGLSTWICGTRTAPAIIFIGSSP
jgi:DNA-binding CsgD family transcriptional regulator